MATALLEEDRWQNEECDIRIIDTIVEAKSVLDNVIEKETTIALDTEFITHPGVDNDELCTIQIGVKPNNIYIFDVLRCNKILSLESLKRLMETNDVLKILHGGDNDSRVLWGNSFQDRDNPLRITIQHVFDTQILQRIVSNCAEGMRLSDLCSEYDIPCQKDSIRISGDFFRERPISPEFKRYAAEDVRVLFPLYNVLKIHLENREIRDQYEKRVQVHYYDHLGKPVGSGRARRKRKKKLSKNTLAPLYNSRMKTS